MKRIKNCILVLLGAVMTSCNALDLGPEDFYSINNYWNSAEQCERFMIGLHYRLRERAETMWLMGESRGGLLSTASVTSTGEGAYNIEAVGTKRAKVCADLYNAIVDHRLTTTSKGSVANIDENGVVKFKGFLIEEVPDDLFQTGEVAYVYIDGVGKAFTGINTARTIESEDFDGVALQGAGKAGEFILPDNKKAVCKVLLNSEYGLDNLTVTSAASSTTSGKTKLTISPALTSGNSYKYKVADNAVLPAAGQSVKGWTAWNGTDEITAATGKEICVVECDSAYRALKAGVATVTAKA